MTITDYVRNLLVASLNRKRGDIDSFIDVWMGLLPLKCTVIGLKNVAGLCIFGTEDFQAYNEDFVLLNELGHAAWANTTLGPVITFYEDENLEIMTASINGEQIPTCDSAEEIEAHIVKRPLTLDRFLELCSENPDDSLLRAAVSYQEIP